MGRSPNFRSQTARWRWNLMLLAVAVAPTIAAPAYAVECPAPEKLTRPGVLRESPAQIRSVASMLDTGDIENHVSVIVSDLRTRYPGVENAEIVNYLVSAYCPVVNQLTGLGEQEKRARLDRFMSEVAKVVY